MSRTDMDLDEPLGDVSETEPLRGQGESSLQPPIRSHYALTRQEIARGIANRFVHSRTYIFLYLGMAALSITTIALSVAEGCPGVAFYILEIIINTTMIAEVSIRFVAFGKRFWKSPFNIVDLMLTMFCAITLLVLAFAGCGSTSKEEAILDTLLLVARNVLQFSRLAAVMRQSGQSIFSPPKPIDLSTARRAGLSLDLDMAYEEEGLGGHVDGGVVLFDEQTEQGVEGPVRPHRTEAVDDRDDEDVWASVG